MTVRPSRLEARVGWCALLAINLLVAAKYGSRLGRVWWLIAFTYTAVVTGWSLHVARRPTPARGRDRAVLWTLVGASIVVQLASLAAVSPNSLRVDRWSAMTAFNTALSHGVFPYAERTHLGNPLWGLPAAYLTGMPFQWLGEVGLLQVAAFLAFALACRRFCSGRYDVSPALALLATSPLMFWEVAVRSDLITNAMLVVMAIMLLERWRDGKTVGRMVAAGALTGWLACTRVAVLAPLVLYLVTYFRRDEARAATIAAVSAAAVASAVLAPFVVWSPRLFAANNPFVHQTALTPLPLVAAAAIACVALGRLTREFSRQCLAAGLVLCGGTAVAFALRASTVGWRTALIGSGFDISYFDLSAPFLVVPLLFVRPVGGSHLAPAGPPAAGGTR